MSNHSDEELEATIRRVAGPVSERHRQMALGAFAWRNIDADLATRRRERAPRGADGQEAWPQWP